MDTAGNREKGHFFTFEASGKGIVQSIVSLGDGTALKVTVSNYYTPNGSNIHEVGIEPDVSVEAGDGEQDIQLEQAQETVKGLLDQS